MIYSVKIAHKHRGQNRVTTECFIEQGRIYGNEICEMFTFLWALDKSDTVVQFTVSNDGIYFTPRDFNWGGLPKWVKTLTYVSDDPETQEHFDNWRKEHNVNPNSSGIL